MSAAYTTPIPAGHPCARSTEKLEEIQKHLSSAGTLRAEHGEVEQWLAIEGRELLRLVLQEHFDLRAAAERPVDIRAADGVVLGRSLPAARGLETIFGEVEASRRRYQAPGRDGLAPLDAILILPTDHYSHGVRAFRVTRRRGSLHKRTGCRPVLSRGGARACRKARNGFGLTAVARTHHHQGVTRNPFRDCVLWGRTGCDPDLVARHAAHRTSLRCVAA